MISMSSYFTVIGLVPTKRLRWGGVSSWRHGSTLLWSRSLLVSWRTVNIPKRYTRGFSRGVWPDWFMHRAPERVVTFAIADSAETRDSSYLPQNKAKTSRETQSSRLLPMSATGAGTAGRRRVCRRTSCRVFRQTSAAATTTSSSSTSSNKCERVGGNQSWYNLPPRIHHCGWMNAWMEPPAIPRHNSSGRHAGSPAWRATLQYIC